MVRNGLPKKRADVQLIRWNIPMPSDGCTQLLHAKRIEWRKKKKQGEKNKKIKPNNILFRRFQSSDNVRLFCWLGQYDDGKSNTWIYRLTIAKPNNGKIESNRKIKCANIPITPNHRFFASSCFAQPGCNGMPPFGKKSAWPSGHGKPNTPPSVWMTSTNFASVALNRADGLLNMYNGKAGSRPFDRTQSFSHFVRW